MSTIKTWAERAESLSDDTVVTSLHLAQFKQDEIDELRSENARLKSALLTNDTTIESANNAAGMLEAENARLRDALRHLAETHARLAFGECRAFGTDTLLTSAEADKVARAALGTKS